jgi:cytochrome c
MPLNQQGYLTSDEVYSLTAYLLYRNGITQEGDVMDAKSLPQVQMPGRDTHVPPPFSEWKLGCASGDTVAPRLNRLAT